MSSIILKTIKQEEYESGIKVFFSISIAEKQYELWYDFQGYNCKLHKVPERFDAIAVLFLYYALRNGFDLVSEYPISEDLYYSLSRHVIPHIYATNKDKTEEISIHAPLISERLSGSWIGSGVSCGVDSLAAIKEYTEEISLKDYQLTHLVYLKVGQHAETLGYNAEAEQKHFDEGLQNALGFSMAVGLPLIAGVSNYNDLVSDAFGYHNVIPTYTYRNLGSVMILQNHFSKYMYASSYGDINHFKVDVDGDIAYYERWLIPMISIENIHFYSASRAMERMEKTHMLVDYPPSYDHLSVCWSGAENCGYCRKCVRTMMTLDLFGALDKFGKSFDVDYYYQRRRDLFTYAYRAKRYDSFLQEIVTYMEDHSMKKPSLIDYAHLYIKKINNRHYPWVPKEP